MTISRLTIRAWKGIVGQNPAILYSFNNDIQGNDFPKKQNLLTNDYRKPKTSELVKCDIREFRASRAAFYASFRLVIREDAAQLLIKDFERID